MQHLLIFMRQIVWQENVFVMTMSQCVIKQHTIDLDWRRAGIGRVWGHGANCGRDSLFIRMWCVRDLPNIGNHRQWPTYWQTACTRPNLYQITSIFFLIFISDLVHLAMNFRDLFFMTRGENRGQTDKKPYTCHPNRHSIRSWPPIHEDASKYYK